MHETMTKRSKWSLILKKRDEYVRKVRRWRDEMIVHWFRDCVITLKFVEAPGFGADLV